MCSFEKTFNDKVFEPVKFTQFMYSPVAQAFVMRCFLINARLWSLFCKDLCNTNKDIYCFLLLKAKTKATGSQHPGNCFIDQINR